MSRSESRSDAPTSPDALADLVLGPFTGYLLKRAYNAVRDDLARTLDPFGLRMLSFSALMVVARQPGITQTQLSQALAMERSNVVALVDGLEAAGLLTRDPVPENRRAHALRPTRAGLARLDQAQAAVEAHEAAIFGRLAEGEEAILRHILGQIAQR